MAGLVSVSFRSLDVEKIIEITKNAGLDTIEWGGDVHVPAGDIKRAEEVARLTEAAGLCTYSYGSYYRVGASDPDDIFGVIWCAEELGTQIVRVWAYNKGSAEVSEAEYERAVADARRICRAAENITFCLECHNNTLTDNYASALKFLADVGCGNLKMYWQPNQDRTYEYNLEAARVLAPYCLCVHVFSWEENEKFPLDYHAERWVEYAKIIRKKAPNAEFMLEFMHDDRAESLAGTADTLKKILNSGE